MCKTVHKEDLIGKEIRVKYTGTIICWPQRTDYNTQYLTKGKKYKILDVATGFDLITTCNEIGKKSRASIMLFHYKPFFKKYGL